MNRLPSVCILLLLLVCMTNGLLVRMTDRKPKWVIEEERRQEALKAERAMRHDPPESNPPDMSDSPSPSVDQNEDPFVPRNRSPEPFSGPDVLLPLSTVCEMFTSAQYRYTVCPYQYVNQIQVNGGNYRGCIGIWKEYSEPPISNSEIRLHMTDGENCFTGTDRETELVISCDDSLDKMLAISAVDEVQTCRYVVEASSPLVCKIPVPEETVSVSVEMGDEVGVRNEEFAAQGHDVSSSEGHDVSSPEGHDVSSPEGHDVSSPEGHDVSSPEGDTSTLEGHASTPEDVSIPTNAATPTNTATPNDNTATPADHSSANAENPTIPNPNPPTNSLQNRIPPYPHQP